VFTTPAFQVTIIEESAIVIQQGCEGNNYKITATSAGVAFDPSTSYAWTKDGLPVASVAGTPNTVIATATGFYKVSITTADGCISESGTINVPSITCQIQRGISPNNDTQNDDFDLSTLNVEKLEIFNRYGTEVYNLENYTKEWHGQSSGGLELPDGTYFYVIHIANASPITGWVYINR
jgi:gliding motility-associated-like protein